MHGVEHSSGVIFGWDPFWVSTAIFIMTYAVVISERVNRAIVSLLGAAMMIMLGVINQQAAIRGVDFNTIGLLTGMMVIVTIVMYLNPGKEQNQSGEDKSQLEKVA